MNKMLDLLKDDLDQDLDERQNTLLCFAAIHGKKDTANLFIEKHGADVNVSDKNGNSLLCLAVENNQQDMVKLLIKHGAKVNVYNQYGNTPLCLAVYNKNQGIAEFLIESGADINVRNILPRPRPFFQSDSIEYPDPYIADVYWNTYKYCEAPLHHAISVSHSALAVYMIERDADVNFTTDQGETPLHKAVFHDDPELVKLLIKRGANMSIADNTGKTPLSLAVGSFNLSMVELLLEHGAYSYSPLKTFESWINDSFIRYIGKKCVIKMLLAGVRIDDDALTNDLKAIKRNIEKVTKEWLELPDLSQEHVPSMLRALPRLFHCVKKINETSEPIISYQSDEDRIDKTKKFYFVPQQDSSSRAKSSKTLLSNFFSKPVQVLTPDSHAKLLKIFSSLFSQSRQDLTPEEKMFKALSFLPNEIQYMIRDFIVEEQMIKKLTNSYSLKPEIISPVWDKVWKKKNQKKYEEQYATLWKHNWEDEEISVPRFYTHT